MDLESLRGEIVACRACPRLVAWRENVAREKVARFADQEYWGRPVPGFGDPAARVLVVGLAPAAHGGNRTGRIFTRDPPPPRPSPASSCSFRGAVRSSPSGLSRGTARSAPSGPSDTR